MFDRGREARTIGVDRNSLISRRERAALRNGEVSNLPISRLRICGASRHIPRSQVELARWARIFLVESCEFFDATGNPFMAESASPETRPSLLLQLRDPADLAAWRSFVGVYGPLVYGLCRRGGLRHEDAEDVTQEVFGRVAKAIRSFEYQPEVGRFRSWLGTLVRNEVNRLFQKKGTDV